MRLLTPNFTDRMQKFAHLLRVWDAVKGHTSGKYVSIESGVIPQILYTLATNYTIQGRVSNVDVPILD